MGYQRSRHRFTAVGDDTVLPPCGPDTPVGAQCAQPANAPDTFVDQVQTLWSSITGTGTGTAAPDPSLPSCATAPVGAKCNPVSAAQAAASASSSSTTSMVLIGGGALLAAYLLFGKKRSRR